MVNCSLFSFQMADFFLGQKTCLISDVQHEIYVSGGNLDETVLEENTESLQEVLESWHLFGRNISNRSNHKPITEGNTAVP